MRFLQWAFPVLFAPSVLANFEILCEQYKSVNTTSGFYTYGTDVWGLDDSGFQCMNVTLRDTQAGSTSKSYTTSFSATWQWAGTSYNATTVHAYPNIALNSAALPLQIKNLSSLTLDLQWSMTPGEVANATTATSAKVLGSIDVMADVAVDLWFSSDPKLANSSTYASTEVMIWQASYGGVEPIGYSTPGIDPPTYSVAGTKYTLYHGTNTQNQSVFTWYPDKNLTSLQGVDVSPLVHYLWRKLYIDQNIYLGLVQWGTEAVHSAKGENVTFWARSVSLDIEVGAPKAAGASVLCVSIYGWGFVMAAAVALFF